MSKTYWVEPCPQTDHDGQQSDEPCDIREMDHYGQPTGELLCHSHGYHCGFVTGPVA